MHFLGIVSKSDSPETVSLVQEAKYVMKIMKIIHFWWIVCKSASCSVLTLLGEANLLMK